MPHVGSDLKSFLLEALSTKKYKNLFYLDELEFSFRLRCPRKDSHEYISENIQIFRDWDAKKNHRFDYSYSRQRLESALKRSIYLVLVSRRKDTYDFRFSSCEEITLKRKHRRSIPLDKYTSDGESHPPSSPESTIGIPLPGHTNSPIKSLCNSVMGTEVRLAESTKETFADDSDDLQNFLVEETEGTDSGFDNPLMDPSLSTTFQDSILEDLCNTDFANYRTENTTLLVTDLLSTSVKNEHEDIQDVNSSIAEQQKMQEIPEKFVDVEAFGCGILEDNVGLDFKIAHSVLELDSTGTGSSSHNTSINIKRFCSQQMLPGD